MKLLTRKDVASLMQVTPLTVDRWRADHGLPYFKLGGSSNGAVRFKEEDVLEWVERRKMNSGMRGYNEVPRAGGFQPKNEDPEYDPVIDDYDAPPDIY